MSHSRQQWQGNVGKLLHMTWQYATNTHNCNNKACVIQLKAVKTDALEALKHIVTDSPMI